MAKYARKITGSNNLCLAGGVALNCVSNGGLLREKLFENLWIQPAAGDAGGALGGAYSVYYQELKNQRTINPKQKDRMQGTYLGPTSSKEDIELYLNSINAIYHYQTNEENLVDTISDLLINEKVVGWHQGRMEFGPRSLGHRSIIGDARSSRMQTILNLKIKYRESFRPFAPSVLREKVGDWFDLEDDSSYMLLVAQVKKDKQLSMSVEQKNLFGIKKLNIPRSVIPAVTHVDYSARIQTVHKDTNPRYYKLINKFEDNIQHSINQFTNDIRSIFYGHIL